MQIDLSKASTESLIELRDLVNRLLRERGVPSNSEYTRGWNDATDELEKATNKILDERYKP